MTKTAPCRTMVLFSNEPITIVAGGSLQRFIFGRVFRRSDNMLLDARAFDNQTGGSDDFFRYLLSQCWGSYAAVAVESDGTAHVLRDPSGAVPCYLAWKTGAVAAVSDLNILVEAGLIRPEVDWDLIDHQFRFPNQRPSATAIHSVSELLPGFSIALGRDSDAQIPLWSPWDYAARSTSHEHLDPARLRETIDQTLSALAGSRKMIVGVSGGLDSSIIAAGLSPKRGYAQCFTVATTEAEGDERRHARRLCRALDLRLHEAFLSIGDIEPTRSSAPHLPRPVGEPYLQSHDAIVRGFAEETGAKTVIRGNGGDAVFCFMQNAWPLVDRLAAEGATFGLWQTFQDTCKITESNARAIWRAVRQYHRDGRRSSALRADLRFLHPSAPSSREIAQHPWLNWQANSLPGRAAHIEWITRVQRFTEGYARDGELELVCPLLAQPIVELCLSVPSWRWIEGGMNRAVARLAYADTIPADLLARTIKGGPDPFCIEILDTFRETIREQLLDGLLAAHGIIDREAVDRYMSNTGPLRDNGYLRVLALADAEAWARHWTGVAGSLSEPMAAS